MIDLSHDTSVIYFIVSGKSKYNTSSRFKAGKDSLL